MHPAKIVASTTRDLFVIVNPRIGHWLGVTFRRSPRLSWGKIERPCPSSISLLRTDDRTGANLDVSGWDSPVMGVTEGDVCRRLRLHSGLIRRRLALRYGHRCAAVSDVA